MPRTEINIGTTANDRTGTKWRAAWGFVNEMTEELYAGIPAAIKYIAQESDFPTQTGSVITLEENILYVLVADVTTAKRFQCEDGAAITALNLYSWTLTYTGAGTMFSGTDVQFSIFDIQLAPSASAEVFNFSETVGGTKRFSASRLIIAETTPCAKFGSFNNMLLVFMNTVGCDCDQGLTFTGTSGVILSLSFVGITSTSASFKAIDLGTATFSVPEFSNCFITAPAGAFGISGLANSGNVNSGSLGMVQRCEFLGGCTDLENITNEDVRWSFKDNNPTPDTLIDMLIVMTNNGTATSAPTTPTKLAGTFTTKRDSFFDTTTVNGRATYIGERDVTGPIDISSTLDVSSGTNKDVTMYVAKNGTEITDTKKTITINSGRRELNHVVDQLTLTTNDYLEIFVSEASGVDVTGIDTTFRFE